MNGNGDNRQLDVPNEEGTESEELQVPMNSKLATSVPLLAMRMQGLSGVGEVFKDLVPLVHQFGQMIAEAVTFDVRPLIEKILVLRDGLNAFIERNPPKEMASKYGWPPMFDMDFPYLGEVYRGVQEIEDEEEKREFLNAKFTAYYQGKELDRLIAGWREADCLKGNDRLIVIEEAFQAHKEGKYGISSPAILAQTEGLFFECLAESDEENPVSKDDYDNLCTRLKDSDGESSIVAFISEALAAFVSGYGLYGSKDEADAGYRDPAAYEVSRHKILHGSSTEYCRREDISLRHLLWLDGVVQVIDYVLNTSESES